MNLLRRVFWNVSEQNKALMSRIIEELWNKKNPAVIGQLYAENYVGHTPDGVLKGHAGARQHYDTYIVAFPDTKIAIDGMVAEGDKVSVRWTATGTHRGELAGIAPTGVIGRRGVPRFRSPLRAFSRLPALPSPPYSK